MIYIKHQMFDVDSINVKQMEYIITFDNLEYEEEFFMNREELKATADRLRLVAVDMVYRGKDGHPGPALSIADIVATLFFDKMRIDPKNPDGKTETASSCQKDMHVRSIMQPCQREDISERR